MKSLLLAATAIAALAGPATAANLITFSQTSGTNAVTATDNVGNTQTTLTATDAGISIGQLISGGFTTGLFSLNAHSIDPATTLLNAVIQHYSGSFCITTAAGCGGTNILSGVFTDAAFGGLGGPGLAVNVNNPPDTLTLTSGVISATLLAAPNAATLAFTNLIPALAIQGTTIAPFTASFAGTVSSSATPAAEPLSIALLGVGILGIAFAKSRRGSAA
jgi:hypothetical protein